MWSDNETDEDYLNYTEVAELICEMVTDATLLPLSVGVYGGWGAGKSSVLNLVEKTLSQRSDTVIVEFDAWLYQGYDEAKSALMTVIASQLLSAAPATLKEKALDLFRRTKKLRLLGLGLEVGLAAVGFPTMGAASKVMNSAQNLWNGDIKEEDFANFKEGATAAKEKTSGLISPKEIKSPPEEIEAFKAEFGDVLGKMQKRLVVFVDNLDRCLPENAIRSLEAMRLFLSMDKTAFIVAADVDIIRHAVQSQFKGASPRHVIDYLDKMIQFPVAVPQLGLREVTSYLCMLIATRSGAGSVEIDKLREYLIDSIQNSWRTDAPLEQDKVVSILGGERSLEAQIDTAFRIAPILAHSKAVSGNPRLIKRMMNVIRMRYATAKRRNMELDEAIITKLALFERCTDEGTFKALLELINNAGNGKPELFDPARRATLTLPDALEQHRPFVMEWLGLEPPLNGVDLRPAIYLARETLPLRLASKTLSQASRDAVGELLKVPTLASKAAKTAIEKIPAAELQEVMHELVSSLRQNSDWSTKRGDLNGAIVLAQEKPETAGILMGLLSRIPDQPPWLKHMILGINK
ncbi:P-loop NTPase fold protein [Rhizobium sp. BR 314]|uniref:KAP family P-loop NTPase fold protein n=1 Tax=Rhizobium sp. BR 314 TaxID=3040013 RepID=UPI0039BED232